MCPQNLKEPDTESSCCNYLLQVYKCPETSGRNTAIRVASLGLWGKEGSSLTTSLGQFLRLGQKW